MKEIDDGFGNWFAACRPPGGLDLQRGKHVSISQKGIIVVLALAIDANLRLISVTMINQSLKRFTTPWDLANSAIYPLGVVMNSIVKHRPYSMFLLLTNVPNW